MTMAAFEPPNEYRHITVMRDEVVRAIAPRLGGLYLDVTAGGGGHSAALLEANPGARVIAFDRDPAAIEAATERLAPFAGRFELVKACFSEVRAELAARGISLVDGLIADLGVSSPQLDEASRGMSFRKEGPLDMRMDPTRGETALELIERMSQEELADVIYQLGEERRSRRVARCIKQAAEAGELSTTSDLRRAIVRATGPRRVGGIDPATRTFQALRLAVNRELDELATLLETAPDILRPGAVAVFISFHSLEDRLVKRAFQSADVWERVTRKPLVASDAEQSENPRSRSAKLRAARRALPGVEHVAPEEFDRDPE